jgi:hypothetical protein
MATRYGQKQQMRTPPSGREFKCRTTGGFLYAVHFEVSFELPELGDFLCVIPA